MKIIVFALEGVFDSGLTVLLDALGLANKFAARQKGGSLSFDVSIVGVRKRVRTAHGLSVPVNGVPCGSAPTGLSYPP